MLDKNTNSEYMETNRYLALHPSDQARTTRFTSCFLISTAREIRENFFHRGVQKGVRLLSYGSMTMKIPKKIFEDICKTPVVTKSVLQNKKGRMATKE